MLKAILCGLLLFAVGALGEARARQRAASKDERPGRSAERKRDSAQPQEKTAPTTARVLCTLGSTASPYNAYLDQRPTGDAMELSGKVNAALVAMCRPNCPTLALFRNSTAANLMLIVDGARTKILYKPEFFTSVYDNYGDGGILALLAHEVGHAIDTAAPPPWMKNGWTPELRADALAGCAFAKMNLGASVLRAGLTTLSKYPSPAHPSWEMRLPALEAGYTQCGGDRMTFAKAGN